MLPSPNIDEGSGRCLLLDTYDGDNSTLQTTKAAAAYVVVVVVVVA